MGVSTSPQVELYKLRLEAFKADDATGEPDVKTMRYVYLSQAEKPKTIRTVLASSYHVDAEQCRVWVAK